MRSVQQSASEVTSSVFVGCLLLYRFWGENNVCANAGFAVVKKGKDKKTGQPVAIKVRLIAVGRVYSVVISLMS